MGRLSDHYLGGDLFDDTQSRERRDAGMAQVGSNNAIWMDSALTFIALLPLTWIGSGEDIRRIVVPKCGSPKHHNAWGALIRSAIQQRLISRTGRRVKMRAVRSHARQTDEYRRT
jgi:hypothetical protein